MKEFKVNDLLKLRLENDKTIIYINDVKIIQCKYLLLDGLNTNSKSKQDSDDKVSIDAQAEDLDHTLEKTDEIIIPPEVEFWAHSSNLQTWYENSYNTQILHSNLAFPLLRKLAQAGDKTAKDVYKKEIIQRFRDGNLNVMTFLIIEGFLDELTIEESDDLLQELDFETYKKLQKRLKESEKRDTFIL